jgi:hypothetical protein
MMDLAERGSLRVRYAEESRAEGQESPAVIEPAVGVGPRSAERFQWLSDHRNWCFGRGP